MKKTILFLLMLIILVSYGSAYVPIETYNGIHLKFYNEEYKENCYEIINQIPIEYFEDIYYIKVMSKSIRYGGLYWWQTKGITLYNGCHKGVLIHELAHHCQYKEGDSFQEGLKHTGHFDECEDEIWESIN